MFFGDSKISFSNTLNPPSSIDYFWEEVKFLFLKVLKHPVTINAFLICPEFQLKKDTELFEVTF